MNYVQMITFWILAVTAQLAIVAIAILLWQAASAGERPDSAAYIDSGLHYVHTGGDQKTENEWDLFSGSCGLRKGAKQILI